MKSETMFWHGPKRMEMEPISCVIRDRGWENRGGPTTALIVRTTASYTIHSVNKQCQEQFFKRIKAQKELSAVYYINKAYIQWCEKSKSPRGNREYDDFPGVKKKSHLGDGESAFDSLINFAES